MRKSSVFNALVTTPLALGAMLWASSSFAAQKTVAEAEKEAMKTCWFKPLELQAGRKPRVPVSTVYKVTGEFSKHPDDALASVAHDKKGSVAVTFKRGPYKDTTIVYNPQKRNAMVINREGEAFVLPFKAAALTLRNVTAGSPVAVAWGQQYWNYSRAIRDFRNLQQRKEDPVEESYIKTKVQIDSMIARKRFPQEENIKMENGLFNAFERGKTEIRLQDPAETSQKLPYISVIPDRGFVSISGNKLLDQGFSVDLGSGFFFAVGRSKGSSLTAVMKKRVLDLRMEYQTMGLIINIGSITGRGQAHFLPMRHTVCSPQ